MGRDLAAVYPVAREVFAVADDVLGFAISKVCWEGPEETLTATENAQPAILTHSTAVVRVLRGQGMEPAAAAGHSLGEFSAHVAAGSLEFADGVRLVRARGEAMAQAGRARPGSMAAIIGLRDAEVEALCGAVLEELSGEGGILTAANFNSPGQIVISGSRPAIRRALEQARSHGARRAVELPVSGAFHSALMEPAAEALADALETVEVRTARIPVVANVDGLPVHEPREIRRRLLEQLTAPVRWVTCVRTLATLGARTFIEPGPGTVLTVLLKRIDRALEGRAVNGPDDIRSLTGP